MARAVIRAQICSGEEATAVITCVARLAVAFGIVAQTMVGALVGALLLLRAINAKPTFVALTVELAFALLVTRTVTSARQSNAVGPSSDTVATRLVARRAEPALGAVACAKRLHFFAMWEGAVVWGLACAVDADTAIAATIAVEGTAPDLSTSSSVPVADALALTSSMIALAMGRATALAITWAVVVHLVAEIASPADLALASVVAGGFVLHAFTV